MVPFVVVIVAGTGYSIYRLQAVFGSARIDSNPADAVNPATASQPKRVILEVLGPEGSVASISYLDVNAHPRRVESTSLPWSYEGITTQPAVLTNVMAQGTGPRLGCRITVDGEVRAERWVTAPGAFTHCLEKAG